MNYDANFYYHPEKSGLELWSVEEDDLCYEFDILAFWAAASGVIYSAEDSGCSCPTPFEDYNSLEELERVGSIAQAESIFDAWNKPEYRDKYKADPSKKHDLTKWLEGHGLT